jgi:hypothetical protein
MTYRDKMIAVVCMPLAACSLACVAFAVIAVLTRAGFLWWCKKVIGIASIIYTVSFVSVVAKCLEVLDCTYLSVEKDELVMKSLPEVVCHSNEWYNDYLVVVAPIMVLYVVVPLAVWMLLYTAGNSRWDRSGFLLSALGVFFRKFKKEYYYYEITSLLPRRFCMIWSVISFSSYPFRSLNLCLFIMIASMNIQEYMQPFEGKTAMNVFTQSPCFTYTITPP